MSLLKYTAKRTITMFGVLIAVVLITTIIVSINSDLVLEQRLLKLIREKIAEEPSICYEYSSIAECERALLDKWIMVDQRST